jgi:acylaminoacyl-peptidase
MKCKAQSFLAGLCLLGSIISPALGGEAAGRRFEPLDVFGLEYASDPQISPDGSQVAYVRNFMDVMKDQRRSNLWTIRFDGSEHRPLTTGSRNDRSPLWSPEGKRLLYVSASDGGAQLYLRFMDIGETAKLTQLTESPRGLSWSPDGRWIAFSMLVPAEAEPLAEPPGKPEGAEWAPPVKVIQKMFYRADGAGYVKDGYSQIFVVPAEGGTPRQITRGAFHHGGRLSWAPDGKSIVFSANGSPEWEYEPGNSEVYEVTLADGALRQLTDRQGPDSAPVLSPDGKLIAYTGYDDRYQFYQVSRLYLMNRDGSGARLLTRGLDRDVQDPWWAEDGKGLYFQYDDQGDSKVAHVTLDGEVRALAENLGGTSLDRPYAGGSFSVARNGNFAFTYSRPEHPADVAVGGRGAPVKPVTRLNQDLLDPKELGAVETIWYESSHDRRKIQGWIVKPPGFDPSKKYPLILEIHGGPVANYGGRFAAEIQLYAAAGYAVLYTNPRGSDSYGEEFGNLIHHNYPGDDFYDLMSGVDAVLARGYVDPQNLFVTGGSGGGVLTAWLVGRTQRFRAAASQKPVINWYSFVLTADMNLFFYKYWFPGFPWENAEHYLERSPLSLVGNVTTPTLVITGEEDYRTPISESEQYYQALKLRKIDTALVRVPGASHDIADRPSQLIAKVANILAWFEKYRVKEKATESN